MNPVRIQVQPGSAYACYNGVVFDVFEHIGTRVTVQIGGQQVDFTTNEVEELMDHECRYNDWVADGCPVDELGG